jgi:hypothetical protein
MPKTDDGFQGLRPFAWGSVWDAMTSPQRRFAFYSDIVVAALGALAVYALFSLFS